jgi:hypothetical protein
VPNAPSVATAPKSPAIFFSMFSSNAVDGRIYPIVWNAVIQHWFRRPYCAD